MKVCIFAVFQRRWCFEPHLLSLTNKWYSLLWLQIITNNYTLFFTFQPLDLCFDWDDSFKGQHMQLKTGPSQGLYEELYSIIRRKLIAKSSHAVIIEEGGLLLVGHLGGTGEKDFQGKSQIGGLAQDAGEGDRYGSLASRPSHIMQHDRSCEKKTHFTWSS